MEIVILVLEIYSVIALSFGIATYYRWFLPAQKLVFDTLKIGRNGFISDFINCTQWVMLSGLFMPGLFMLYLSNSNKRAIEYTKKQMLKDMSV